MDNIRRRIVGVMFPPSIFEDRCIDFRRSRSRCVDLRKSMCRLLKIDVSTFGDGCVDLRRPMIDVSILEDR